MNKEIILDAIKTMAEANNGVAPGKIRFAKETGMGEYHWQKYWSRWGDALKEAGFEAKSLLEAYDENFLLETLAKFVSEIGRIPTTGDHRVKSHAAPGFPSTSSFEKLGTRSEKVRKLLAFCQGRVEFDAVAKLCAESISDDDTKPAPREGKDDFEVGFIYLLKSGRFYKLGRSNAFGRRERELAIQLPDKADTVHVIKTDDPIGIEAYWHKRFEARRRNGEWFELSADDVKAFKRRKIFM